MLGPHGDLMGFLDTGWPRNLQTSYLLNRTAREIESDEAGSLGMALARIERDFAFVGLVERFDESVQELARRLAWTVPEYRTLNTGAGRAVHLRREQLPRVLLRRIEAVNRVDRAVYEAVRAGAERSWPAATRSAA
jgi:hypothetical protein